MSAFKKQSSKFKNTFGRERQRDDWYCDVRGGTTSGDSNNIAASANHIVFPAQQAGGGSLYVLPITDVGKHTGDLARGCAHGSALSDLTFNSFDDDLLATGGEDAAVRVWRLNESLDNAVVSLDGHAKRVDALAWNPVASGVLASISGDQTLKVWDVESGSEAISLECFEDAPQSLGWSYDGRLLVATSKDKKLHVIDARSGNVETGTSHDGIKGSRCVWLGDTGKIATTGYNSFRSREFAIFDVNNLSSSLSRNTIDSSTGILMPFYDADTKLLFLAGKGDTAIRYFEITSGRTGFSECGRVNASNQQTGVAMLPKRAMDVMDCEVARLLQLTANDVVPISFEVPRRTKSEYYPELFPDTRGTTPGCDAVAWLGGEDAEVALVDLTPEVTTTYAHMETMAPTTNQTDKKFTSSRWSSGGGKWGAAGGGGGGGWGGSSSGGGGGSGWKSTRTLEDATKVEEEPEPEVREVVVPKVVRTSKFRHIAGKGTKKELCWDNVRANVAAAIETTCAANSRYISITWEGVTGQVCVLDIDNPHRLPVEQPIIECPTNILDMAWCPFQESVLATACEDTIIRIWTIPEGGITENLTTPTTEIGGHGHKVNTVCWHPTVENVLATSSADRTVRVWNVATGAQLAVCEGFGDQPQNIAFNWEGDLIAASCKDKIVRVYDARSGAQVGEAHAHDGARAFKVLWLGDTGRLATCGFTKGSKREVKVWDGRNLGDPIGTAEFDVSSGALMPHYDEGTGILFLAGRGDGNIRTLEINDKKPYIHEVAPYTSTTPMMGLAKLPTYACNIANVEFAKFIKLSGATIEPITFTVPRQKKEFFQDDIFPPARASNVPTCNADEWMSGADASPTIVSLQPEGMEALSEQDTGPKKKKFVKVVDPNEDRRTEKEKLMDNFNKNLDENMGDQLPQDAMEGADATEWQG